MMGNKPIDNPNYQELIDTDTWEFIHKTSELFPSNVIELDLEEQRQYYDAMCQFFAHTMGASVGKKDYKLGCRQVKVREYQNIHNTDKKTLLLYLHGGGFVFGNLASHDSICASLCQDTQLTVIACEYALAPEHRYPDALADVLSVFSALTYQSQRDVILVGDSAGATLCASLSAFCRAKAIRPIAQVLIYPYLGAPLNQGSAMYHANAPMLTTDDVRHYETMRLEEDYLTQKNGQTTPLFDEDFSNLPDTYIVAAECDPLCDDAKLYSTAIRAAGGKATCIIEAGLVHGYLRATKISSKAKASFDRLKNIIVSCSNEDFMF